MRKRQSQTPEPPRVSPRTADRTCLKREEDLFRQWWNTLPDKQMVQRDWFDWFNEVSYYAKNRASTPEDFDRLRSHLLEACRDLAPDPDREALARYRKRADELLERETRLNSSSEDQMR